MKKSRIKVMSMLLFLVLITLCFSGCIDFSEFTPPPEGPSKHPDDPAVAVDSKGNVHIVWENGTGSKEWPVHLSYAKLNNSTDKLSIIKSFDGYEPRIVVDSDDNIYIIQGALSYMKLDNNGDVLINTTSISSNNSHIIAEDKIVFIDSKDNIHICFRGDYIYHTIINKNEGGVEEYNITPYDSVVYGIQAIIDSENNVHISWQEIKNNTYEIHYAKQASNGTFLINNKVVVEDSIHKLDNSALAIDGNNNIYIFWDEYSNDSYIDYDIPTNSYFKKFDCNGLLIYSGEVNSQRVAYVYVDPMDHLHLFGTKGEPVYYATGEYSITDVNGTPIMDAIQFTEGVSLDSSINIVKYGDKIHLTWYHEELRTWRSGRHYREYEFYTVYYSKIDSNGTILVDQMIVDSDGEPSWENTTSPISTLLWVVVVCLIAAAVIIATLLFLRRKHAKHP